MIMVGDHKTDTKAFLWRCYTTVVYAATEPYLACYAVPPAISDVVPELEEVLEKMNTVLAQHGDVDNDLDIQPSLVDALVAVVKQHESALSPATREVLKTLYNTDRGALSIAAGLTGLGWAAINSHAKHQPYRLYGRSRVAQSHRGRAFTVEPCSENSTFDRSPCCQSLSHLWRVSRQRNNK